MPKVVRVVQKIKAYTSSVVDLCYPPLCVHCDRPLSEVEGNRTEVLLPGYLCKRCCRKLTVWKESKDNPLNLKDDLLHLGSTLDPEWVAVSQQTVAWTRALFAFDRKNAAASLIHQLKYHRKTKIGSALGRQCAKRILLPQRAFCCDAIVPVPIHWRKMFTRGYNQSSYIARGISKETNIPICHALQRTRPARSQTKKSRADRLKMSDPFVLKDPNELQGSSVLLVDDVMTTGTTLWKAHLPLVRAGVARIGILSISAVVGKTQKKAAA